MAKSTINDISVPKIKNIYEDQVYSDRLEYKKVSGFMNKSSNWGVEIECFLSRKMTTKLIAATDKKQKEIFKDLSTLKKIQLEMHIRSIKKLLEYFLIGDDSSIETNHEQSSSYYDYDRDNDDYLLPECPFEFKSQIFTTYDGLAIIENFYDTLKPRFNYTCGIHLNIGMDSIKHINVFFVYLIIYHKLIAIEHNFDRCNDGNEHVCCEPLRTNSSEMLRILNKNNNDNENNDDLDDGFYDDYDDDYIRDFITDDHYNIINNATEDRLEIRTLGGETSLSKVTEFIRSILIGLELCNKESINEKNLTEFVQKNSKLLDTPIRTHTEKDLKEFCKSNRKLLSKFLNSCK